MDETTGKMAVFMHEGFLYIRVLPSKQLLRSTMLWEAVNRGSILAVRVMDSVLTIIPGTVLAEHAVLEIPKACLPADQMLQQTLFRK